MPQKFDHRRSCNSRLEHNHTRLRNIRSLYRAFECIFHAVMFYLRFNANTVWVYVSLTSQGRVDPTATLRTLHRS